MSRWPSRGSEESSVDVAAATWCGAWVIVDALPDFRLARL